MAGERILVVEDDGPIRQGLLDALRFAGYEVLSAEDGAEAIDHVRSSELDLVLLDIMLPKHDGFEVLRQIRQSRSELAVIMVTARGAEPDRVRGLTDGADDYVVKPFNARELVARVQAVLRRAPQRRDASQVLRAPGVAIDLDRREVHLEDGRREELSDRETEILRYLASNRGRAVARAELLRQIWGLNSRRTHTRTLDMHVSRLRDKLGPAGPQLIVTVRSVGYKLSERFQSEEP